MKLIIDIPENDWEFIKETDGCRWSRAILDGVINGTPLEEELEKIRKEMEIIHNSMCIPCQKTIDSGKCPTLKELFNKEDDGK